MFRFLSTSRALPQVFTINSQKPLHLQRLLIIFLPFEPTVLRQLLPGDWQENTRGYRVRDKLFLEWGDRFGWPDKDNALQEGKPVCYGMRNQFGILSNGTVVPCCLDSNGVIDLGNVFERPLAEILASPRAKAIADGFQKGVAAEELCRRCPYARKKQH